MEYYRLHTAKYATVILGSDWLYFSRHGINKYIYISTCKTSEFLKVSEHNTPPPTSCGVLKGLEKSILNLYQFKALKMC